MLLIQTELNLRIAEKEWWMRGYVFLSGENNCLVRSGLNGIFYWYAQSCSFNRSLEVLYLKCFYTVCNAKLSAKKLISEFSPCGRSFR